MKRKFAAFDDLELKSWLLELIADQPPGFLRALAEAVVAADPDEYTMIRPTLLRFRQKYGRQAERNEDHRPQQATDMTELPEKT